MNSVSLANQNILLSGMGRSGTTWCSEIINCNDDYRIIFEPFLPAKVSLAREFEYLQYFPSGHCDASLERSVKKIFDGDVNAPWIDRKGSNINSEQILIKEIRTNLMLGWLHSIQPNTPIVLMIRHPLQVIGSWLQLGWKTEAFGTTTNFETIIGQDSLLADFPVIANASNAIDPSDPFQDVLFQWCVYHLVPLSQLYKGDAYVLFYEDLLMYPEKETRDLLNYLKIPYDWDRISLKWRTASSTNFLKRDFDSSPKQDLLNAWRSKFSPRQIKLADEMLSNFGLDKIYNEEGMPLGNPLRVHDFDSSEI